MQCFCSPKSMCRTRTVTTVTGRTECKIKAHGANQGLHPCLHIDFYGSTDRHAALWSDGDLNNDNGLAWFHALNLTCFSPDEPE